MYLGSLSMGALEGQVQGEFVSLGGEPFYRIAHYDRMDPFFMSVVSASDHWMFVSSNGGLTAGRRNADHALFPYYPVDRIHDSGDHTGPRTVLRVVRDDRRSPSTGTATAFTTSPGACTKTSSATLWCSRR
jgi:hypothetical protein